MIIELHPLIVVTVLAFEIAIIVQKGIGLFCVAPAISEGVCWSIAARPGRMDNRRKIPIMVLLLILRVDVISLFEGESQNLPVMQASYISSGNVGAAKGIRIAANVWSQSRVSCPS